LSFGPDFLWGTATAAHQIEGNNVNSDWWALEHAGTPLIKEPSGDAADSYHRWREDMDLLAGAGFTDYRFSVEWARIEPAPGEFSAAAIAHYRRMVEGALERGLRPLVTLHHFTNPLWLDQVGGWAGDRVVDHFVRYVEALEPILASGVERVCTINEPHVVAVIQAVKSTPDVERLAAAGITPDARATDALIQAHHKAAASLHSMTSGLQVGWSIACMNIYGDPGSEAVAAEYARPRETVYVEAARDDDFIGVQSYTRTKVGLVDGKPAVIKPAADVELTINGWEYYPQAIGDAIRSVRALVPGVPIIVTENGIAASDDSRRIDYTTEALASIEAAMRDGADVRGYFHWSLIDNYEWGSYKPTFGLIAFDHKTFVRTPKPSFAWLGAQCPARHASS
jgi:beta-glucosidase